MDENEMLEITFPVDPLILEAMLNNGGVWENGEESISSDFVDKLNEDEKRLLQALITLYKQKNQPSS